MLQLALFAALSAHPVYAAGPKADPTASAGPSAKDTSKSGSKKEDAKADKTDFSISGVYAIWGLTQRNFMLGADHPLNNADYVVQMLRLAPRFDRPSYGVVARLDAAQGWWGVDNDPNTTSVESHNPDDQTTTSATAYNADAMFGNKDTNYGVHFDHAYVWFNIPGLPVDVRVQAGRMNMQVGQKLVLDQDLDGITVTIAPESVVSVELLGAKFSEGLGSVKAPTGALMSDEDAYADANMAGARLMTKSKTVQAELFGLFYNDASGDGEATYLPQGYGYFNSRHRPNISMATAVGISATGKFPVAEGLAWAAEGDWLMGRDDVKNRDHAGGVLDINNGTLSGWNALLKADQSFDAGIPLGVGATFGMGSGDDDVTGGQGNLNKIQTMGSFPLTNVWEDSVMPDVGGISPQGLGSPVSRGYREFENTTAVQGRVRLKPARPLELTASYTWLHATQPIRGFDAEGAPTADSTQDLGSEVDVNGVVTITKGLSYAALFGYFMPGAAASRLITGTAANTEAAWEIKQVLMAKF